MNGSGFEGDDAGEVSSELDSLLREAARTPQVMWKPADINRVGSKVGKFLVRAELGRGGMGIVYLAEDTKLLRDVALKVLPAFFVDEERKRRFLGEARAAARVSHPNVTAVFEVGEDAGDTFIAMEYVDGRTLRRLLVEHGGAALPVPQALRIARAIADGLECAHVAGIVHRDLKPENVMLARNGLVKILDFGLAKSSVRPERVDGAGGSGKSAEESAARGEDHATVERRVMGTPSYMSPEQAAGRPLDLRSDLFSFGVMLYEMVTGARPFSGSTVKEVLLAIERDVPEAASKRSSAGLPELDRLLDRCLAKRPEDRCEGAFEIRAAIDSMLAAHDLAATPLAPAGVIGKVDPRARPSSASRESVTGDERGFLSVILVDAGAPCGGAPPVPEEISRIASELLREAERRGARAELLSGAMVAVTLADPFVVTDLARSSASAALALGALAPRVPIALAMGTAEGSRGQRRDELIGRARAMLARRAVHDDGGMATSILLDEMSHDLLGAHYDVRRCEDGLLLVGELGIPDMERTLLGKPTACVGRDRELAALMAFFNECIEGPLGRAMLVTSPAGMGKSRLMREMLRIVRRQHGADISIWVGSGDPLCVDSAFGILGHALSDACAIQVNEPLERRRAKLEARVSQTVAPSESRRIVEFLGELIGAPYPGDESAPLRAARQDAELMGEQMRRAFLELVAAETSRRPLLIVLEDLHWSDGPTVRFIDMALRVHSDKPLMVLALGRPEVHERFPELWATRDVHQIHLKPLSRKAAEQLVRQVLGRGPSNAVVERVVGLSDGHPFYLEELIRTAAEGQSEALPTTVIAMVQARLMDIDKDARWLLQAASIFGEVFWQSAAEALAGGGAEGLMSTLLERELIERRLDSRFPGEREYAFRHALLREGAYAMSTEPDLVLGHRLAGEWLEQHGEREPMVMAEHFERGGRPRRAASYYADAAVQDLRAGDADAAISCAKRGLACDAGGDCRLRLIGVLGEAYTWRRAYDQAAPYMQEVMRLSAPGSAAYVSAVDMQMGVAMFSGKFVEFIAWVEAALAVSPSPEAVATVARIVMAAAAILPLVGQPDRSEAYLQRLQTFCEGPGRNSPVARGWMHFARSFTSVSVREEAWPALREAMAACLCMEEAGYRKGQANAQIQVGTCAWMLGDLDRAFRELHEPIALDPDLPEVASHRICIVVDLMLARGDIEAARREACSLTERARAKQILTDEALGRYALARVLHAGGDHDAAAREATLAGDLFVFPTYQFWSLALLSSIRLSQGREAEALDAARQAVLGCEAIRNFGYRGAEVRLAYAVALEASGKHDEARRRIASESAKLLSMAASIEDDAIRRSYLEEVPAHAHTLRLARAWHCEPA